MSDQSGELRALKREWLLARLVLIFGALAPVVLFLWLNIFPGTAPGQVTMTEPQAQLAPEPVHREDEAAEQGMRLCVAVAASAKNFGVVPLSTHADGPAGTSDTTGRYLCRMSSGADGYVIAVDLECRNLGDPRCLSLFSVTRENGQILFQRQG